MEIRKKKRIPTDGHLQALLRERQAQLRKWNEARATFLAPVDTQIAAEVQRLLLLGASISQICEIMGTKNRQTVMNYRDGTFAGADGASGGDSVEPPIDQPWSALTEVENMGGGIARVTVRAVPPGKWTQTRVPQETYYNGWAEYSNHLRIVVKSSEKVSPLVAEMLKRGDLFDAVQAQLAE